MLRHAPVLAVIIPLFTAAILAALTKTISESVSRSLALAAAVLVIAVDAYLVFASQSNSIVYWFGGWTPHYGATLGISFVIDPIGAGLACLAAILTVAALVFSAQYFDNAENHLHALIIVFLGALQGFTLTGDLFNLFVFFELMSAAAFALCAHKVEDPGSLQGALNFAVTNTIGAYFVLTGVGLLYARAGALNMAQIGQALSHRPADRLILIGFAFIVCGYLVKGALVPFHFWLADAHAVAPTPICILFSGIMVEMGLYAVARIYWTVFQPVVGGHVDQLRLLFLGLGALTAILGAILCYTQRNLKRLLAFSTISHMGILTMGFGLFTPTALAGVAIYVLGHGFIKSALFLTAGILLHRFESVNECELHGKGRGTKWTGTTYFLGALCLSGLPFSGLLAGHELIGQSSEHAGYGWVAYVAQFAAIVTAAAALRAGGRIFFGWGPAGQDPGLDQGKNEEKPETGGGHDCTPSCMFVPAILLVLIGLGLGLVPGLLGGTTHAAARFVDSMAYAGTVLQNQPFPSLRKIAMPAVHPMQGLVPPVLAILVASLHLFSHRARSFAGVLSPPITLLRTLHSGHVGDYVAFLTLGVGTFGIFCITLLGIMKP